MEAKRLKKPVKEYSVEYPVADKEQLEQFYACEYNNSCPCNIKCYSLDVSGR